MPPAELSAGKARSSAVASTTRVGSSFGSAVAASSGFCTLAGRRGRWGAQAPRTAPVSRSATTQEIADRVGADPPGGTARSVVPSWVPPTTAAAGSRTGDGGVGGIVGVVMYGHGTAAGAELTTGDGPTTG